MTVTELFNLIAPDLAYSPDVDAALALGLVQVSGWVSLPQSKRDEAQALYAAWILSARAGGAPGGGFSGVLIMQQAGDTKQQFSNGAVPGITAADLGNYKARFEQIRRLAGYGSILTRDPAPDTGPFAGPYWPAW